MSSDLSQFFGDLSGTVVDVKQDQYYQNTHELPDAYIGRNRFLMSTLDYLITREGRDFLTNVILPFEHTDNTNVAWEVFHFDRSLADIEPEQGVPRYVTMKQDIKKDRLVRRGLAFMIEHGFYTTDIGRRHYMMNIQQIVDAVAETTALQALHAMIEITDFYSVCPNDFDARRDFFVEQLRRFAVIQRGNHGMHILDSDLKDAMLRYNIRPDSYIMPPRSTSYINMRDPYMTEYRRGGRGVEALEGPDQQLTFRGTRVYEARYFETDYVSEPYDPLSQIITYAEYYHCDPRMIGVGAEASGCAVYDFTRDTFVNIVTPVPGAAALAAPFNNANMQGWVRMAVREFLDKERALFLAHAALKGAGGRVRPMWCDWNVGADGRAITGAVTGGAAPNQAAAVLAGMAAPTDIKAELDGVQAQVMGAAGAVQAKMATDLGVAVAAIPGATLAAVTQAVVDEKFHLLDRVVGGAAAPNPAQNARRLVEVATTGVLKMRDLSDLEGLQFMRMKDVADAETFGSKFLSNYDAIHHDAVIEHLAELPSGSIVRAKYVKDFIKSLE